VVTTVVEPSLFSMVSVPVTVRALAIGVPVGVTVGVGDGDVPFGVESQATSSHPAANSKLQINTFLIFSSTNDSRLNRVTPPARDQLDDQRQLARSNFGEN
jgi:hypothetical protein